MYNNLQKVMLNSLKIAYINLLDSLSSSDRSREVSEESLRKLESLFERIEILDYQVTHNELIELTLLKHNLN